MKYSVYIGWEPRESAAFAVAKSSITRRSVQPVPIKGLIMQDLQKQSLYHRPHEKRGNQLWDVISDAPMATEFACTRFLVPHIVKETSRSKPPRWAVFMDCDMLVRTNIMKLFEQADPSKAVQVVKHDHNPKESTKMDGQAQTRYSRKNWSSVMLFNVDHPANEKLTPELVNSVPGRDLHAFCWLKDDEIGELDAKWNYLVGHTKNCPNPAIVHHTDGIPMMPGYEDAEYAEEWWEELHNWAR